MLAYVSCQQYNVHLETSIARHGCEMDFIKAGVQRLMRAQNTFIEIICANLDYIYLKEHALIVLLVMLVSGIVQMVM